MRELILGGSHIAVLVDDADYVDLVSHRWYIHPKGYAQAFIEGKMVLMHRFIMQPPKHLQVDHKDGNKANNQRSNLRIVTKSVNAQNVPPKANNTSGFVGVARNGKYWQSAVYKNGKRHFVGTFKDAVSAAIAYNAKAVELYGENTYQNPIPAQ